HNFRSNAGASRQSRLSWWHFDKPCPLFFLHAQGIAPKHGRRPPSQKPAMDWGFPLLYRTSPALPRAWWYIFPIKKFWVHHLPWLSLRHLNLRSLQNSTARAPNRIAWQAEKP